MTLHKLQKHYNTSQHVKIQEAVEFLKVKEIKISLKIVFEFFEVKQIQDYEILQEDSHTQHNQLNNEICN